MTLLLALLLTACSSPVTWDDVPVEAPAQEPVEAPVQEPVDEPAEEPVDKPTEDKQPAVEQAPLPIIDEWQPEPGWLYLFDGDEVYYSEQPEAWEWDMRYRAFQLTAQQFGFTFVAGERP